MYIFGYGSLMNSDSLARTLPGKTIRQYAALQNYERIFNAPVGKYLYLNIRPRQGSQVRGVLIDITPDELELLRLREPGYDYVEVTKNLDTTLDKAVFAFIAPDNCYPHLKVLKSYIQTCLRGVPTQDQETWLQESILLNDIFDDLSSPVYENVAE